MRPRFGCRSSVVIGHLSRVSSCRPCTKSAPESLARVGAVTAAGNSTRIRVGSALKIADEMKNSARKKKTRSYRSDKKNDA
jgi:hypothetical protein